MKLHFLILYLFILNTLCFGNSKYYLEPNESQVRVSAESISVQPNEDMGLVGIHYDWVIDQFYWGIGGYGAMTGDRGGYFTAGVSAGYRYPLCERFFLDANLFLGGGGGASAFPGSGFMVRERIGIGLKLGHSQWILGTSHQSVSGIDIGINYSLGYTYRFYGLDFADKKQGVSYQSPKFKSLSISSMLGVYQPEYKITRTGKKMANDVSLLGFQFREKINDSLNAILWLMGAGGTGHDGYGKILFGIEKHWQIASIKMAAQIAFGMSGGGDIDTGAGAIIQSGITFSHPISKAFTADYFIGFTDALDGPYEAWLHTLGISWHFETASPKKSHSHYHINQSDIDHSTYKIQVSNKTYFPRSNQLNKEGNPYEDAMQFIGFTLEKSISENWDILASTYWAWEGNIGAYAEGNFGARYRFLKLNQSNLFIQSEIGVAGGGGVSVGSGSIWFSSIGVTHPLTPKQDVSFQVGYVDGFEQTSFEGTLLQFSFTQHFNLITQKNH